MLSLAGYRLSITFTAQLAITLFFFFFLLSSVTKGEGSRSIAIIKKFFLFLLPSDIRSMGGSPGDVSENPVT